MENLQKASERVKKISSLLNRANDVCAAFNRYEETNCYQATSSVYMPLLGKHIN